MPRPEPLSAASKRRIVSAAEESARLIDEGETPDHATAKAAAAAGVPPGHLETLVHSINTGQAETQRLNGEDPAEKAASVPLADLDKVRSLMYTMPETTPVRHPVSEDYSSAPTWYARHKKAATKAALFPEGVAEPPAVPAPSMAKKKKRALPDPHAKTLDILSTQTKQAAVAFREVDAAQADLVVRLEKIGRYFWTPDHTPWPIVKENCEVLFGKTAAAVMDAIVDRVPTYGPEELLLSYRGRPASVEHAPYRDIKAAVDAARECIAKEAGADEKAALVTDLDTAIDYAWPKPIVKGAGVMEKAVGMTPAFLAGRFSAGGDSLRGIAGKLSNPSQTAQMRAIKTQANLADLLSHDEVLKTYPPHEVIEQYNQLAQLAPRSVEIPDITRAVLRQRMQSSAPAPVDLNMVLNLEKGVSGRTPAPRSILDEDRGDKS